VMKQLLDAISDPYAYFPDNKDYYTLPGQSTHPYRTYCGT